MACHWRGRLLGVPPAGARRAWMPGGRSLRCPPPRSQRTPACRPGPAHQHSPTPKHTPSCLRCSAYTHFIWLNSSVRGPFLPSYLRGTLHWSAPLLGKLGPGVKLVGATVNCGGAYGRPPAPHVQSYLAATDHVGLQVRVGRGTCARVGLRWVGARHLRRARCTSTPAPDLHPRPPTHPPANPRTTHRPTHAPRQVLLERGTVFRCWDTMEETVLNSEIGASQAILDAGFTFDCLMLRYQARQHGGGAALGRGRIVHTLA